LGNQKQNLFLRNDGQSTVEYVLLLMVVVTLSLSVFRGRKFQEFFGKDSEFFIAMGKRIEFAYQHGYEGPDTGPVNYNGNHPTFFDPSTGSSRFFIQESPYKGFGP
jgi:hypothetical protein